MCAYVYDDRIRGDIQIHHGGQATRLGTEEARGPGIHATRSDCGEIGRNPFAHLFRHLVHDRHGTGIVLEESRSAIR
jgi:hypothetical protein